jgi:hypothetical protein
MFKVFCDRCGQETSHSYVGDRLDRKEGDWRFYVVLAYKGTWNYGHLCFQCLKRIIELGLEQEEKDAMD